MREVARGKMLTIITLTIESQACGLATKLIVARKGVKKQRVREYLVEKPKNHCAIT